jgi:hypothetical protein
MLSVINKVCMKPRGRFGLSTNYSFGSKEFMFPAMSAEIACATYTTTSLSSQSNEAIKVPKHEFIKQHWLV